MGLSAADLAGMQACAQDYLPESATILRLQGGSSDGKGGTTGATYTAIATSVPARIAPFPPRRGTSIEPIAAERVSDVPDFQVILPAGTDITARDQIQIGARVFEVGSVEGERSFEVSLVCLCMEQR